MNFNRTVKIYKAHATADLVVSQHILLEEESLDIPHFG